MVNDTHSRAVARRGLGTDTDKGNVHCASKNQEAKQRQDNVMVWRTGVLPPVATAIGEEECDWLTQQLTMLKQSIVVKVK